jgi:hypothetical protein
MKNFRKSVLPVVAAVTIGLVAFAAPAGASASAPASITFTEAGQVAAFPLTGLKKAWRVITDVANVVTAVTKLVGNANNTQTPTPQLSDTALD